MTGSTQSALETAFIIRSLISSSKWANAHSLISLLCHLGGVFALAQPSGTDTCMLTGLGISIGNIIRRILRLIREEYKGFPSDSTQETQSNIEHPMMAMMMTDKPLFSPSPSLEMLGHWHAGDSSMFNLLATPTRQAGTEIANLERSKYELKQILFQGVNELIDEIENSIKQIEAHAYDHINNGYVIAVLSL